MRERTPSADDTPKRAPPAPPGEADVAVRKATDVASAAAYGASKMVASTHSLDELGVSQLASASQQHHQAPHHQQPSSEKQPKSQQDKRSRLSNLINNLRKKVPPEPPAQPPALDPLERYVMTVLNGVIDEAAPDKQQQQQQEEPKLQEPALLDAQPPKDPHPSEAHESQLDAAEPEPEQQQQQDKTLGAIILGRLQPAGEAELRAACRALLDDLLGSVCQALEADEPSAGAQQSLHCSLPLDKVASVLQGCQATEQPGKPQVRHLCLYCDRKFLSISLRQRHTERVHQASGGRRSERNSRKPTQQHCQYCVDKCSEGLEGLFQHMVGSHSDKYHGCLQCSTRYLTRDALASHVHEAHSQPTQPPQPPPQEPTKEPKEPKDEPEFDHSFYSSVSCNIRENLLHHIDGKLQADCATASAPQPTASDGKQPPQYQQLPIDISLTAVAPVHSKDYPKAPGDYENSSEHAGKPDKSCPRTGHPRRVSFEKYNFPRKYDGKEQSSCSIKDLSKFDISTQLTLRKKQQLAKDAAGSGSRLQELTPLPEQPGGDPIQIKIEPTAFGSEFGSFMRLKKREEGSSSDRKSLGLVYAELTGEWSRPRVYICGACAERYITLKELEEHKSLVHPNVWCMHFEFSGDQRELYKHLVFLPGAQPRASSPQPSAMKTRQQSQPPERVCTKCSKSCLNLSELHRHMLECGGDQAWLLGLFGNGKKKCKWRPFGSRSRRRRQRGMKRNIQNSQTPRNQVPKERPTPSGPRVRPSDRESIQKMLANLPAKRATRKVLQENAARSQGRLRNAQSRSAAADNPASRIVKSKAVLRNKLLKNAKSFHRKKNLREEKQQENDAKADAEDEAETSRKGVTGKGAKLRNARVINKKKNVTAKESVVKQAEQPKRRIKLRSSLASKEEVESELVASETVKKKVATVKTGKTVESEDGRKKKKRLMETTASLKAKSQLRSNDGKFARGNERKGSADVPIDTKSLRIRRPINDPARLLTRLKLRAAATMAWKEHTKISRRMTRLHSVESEKNGLMAVPQVVLSAIDCVGMSDEALGAMAAIKQKTLKGASRNSSSSRRSLDSNVSDDKVSEKSVEGKPERVTPVGRGRRPKRDTMEGKAGFDQQRESSSEAKTRSQKLAIATPPAKIEPKTRRSIASKEAPAELPKKNSKTANESSSLVDKKIGSTTRSNSRMKKENKETNEIPDNASKKERKIKRAPKEAADKKPVDSEVQTDVALPVRMERRKSLRIKEVDFKEIAEEAEAQTTEIKDSIEQKKAENELKEENKEEASSQSSVKKTVPGKRRGRAKRVVVETVEEPKPVEAPVVIEEPEKIEEKIKDIDVPKETIEVVEIQPESVETKVEDQTPTNSAQDKNNGLQNLSLEHLQQESSNSNMDSGKENSSETIVHISKLKVVRPKKTRGFRKDNKMAGTKRSLSSVIGILTEGVNVLAETQEPTVVLTVQTNVENETNNPENVCQSSDQQQPSVESSSSNPEEGGKSEQSNKVAEVCNSNPNIEACVSVELVKKTDEEIQENAVEEANVVKQDNSKPVEESAKPALEPVIEKQDDKEVKPCAVVEPTNDIIFDLSRRKPKGKGSFLEKIVSKIAKQKDVSLEGESSCHLDVTHVSAESKKTSENNEKAKLLESSSIKVVEEVKIESVLNKESNVKLSESVTVNIVNTTESNALTEIKNVVDTLPMSDKINDSNVTEETLIKCAEVRVETIKPVESKVKAVNNEVLNGAIVKVDSHETVVSDSKLNLTENEEIFGEKCNQKSKKRSLESNSPKKNKKKSVDSEEIDEDENNEEICLADIMKLIGKPKVSEVQKEGSVDQQTVKPGKRKTPDDETGFNSVNANGDIELTSEDYKKEKEIKKSKRKSGQKKNKSEATEWIFESEEIPEVKNKDNSDYNLGKESEKEVELKITNDSNEIFTAEKSAIILGPNTEIVEENKISKPEQKDSQIYKSTPSLDTEENTVVQLLKEKQDNVSVKDDNISVVLQNTATEDNIETEKITKRKRKASRKNSKLVEQSELIEETSYTPDESFKVPESTEFGKSTKKRASRRRSSFKNLASDVELEKDEDDSNDKPSIEEKLELSSDGFDQNSSMSESEERSIPKRTSKRSTRNNKITESEDTQTSIKESDDSDVSSASETESTRRRRSQRKSAMLDKELDISVSSVDENSSFAESNIRNERHRNRKSKKNVSLADEHLELPTGNEITENKITNNLEVLSEDNIIKNQNIEESINKSTEEVPEKIQENSEMEKIITDEKVNDESIIRKSETITEKSDDLATNMEKTLEVEKSDEKASSTPLSQISSLDEYVDTVDKSQSMLTETSASELDESANLDLQTPKKRPAANFAIVNKSGKILIVEKKKKLTKEAAKFFCNVCATSFTRKSSLKKHNSSQSHILQITMSGDKGGISKEDLDILKVSEEPENLCKKDADMVIENQRKIEEEVQKDEIDSLNDIAKEKETEKQAEKATEAEMEKETEKETEEAANNKEAIVSEKEFEKEIEVHRNLIKEDKKVDLCERTIEDSMDLSMNKSFPSISPVSALIIPEPTLAHKSPQEELEDEMLDEEICKITENMSHDEYVLTDHVSVNEPEAASTPIKEDIVPALEPEPELEVKITLKKEKKKKEKRKKNLAEEHLDLSTPINLTVTAEIESAPEEKNLTANLPFNEVAISEKINASVANLSEEEPNLEDVISQNKRESKTKKNSEKKLKNESKRGRRNKNLDQDVIISTSENTRPKRNQLRPSYKEDENFDFDIIDSFEDSSDERRVSSRARRIKSTLSFVESEQSDIEKEESIKGLRETSRSRRDKNNKSVIETEIAVVEKDATIKKSKGRKSQNKKRTDQNEKDNIEILSLEKDEEQVLNESELGITLNLEKVDNESELELGQIHQSIVEEQKASEEQTVAPKKKRGRKPKKVQIENEEPVVTENVSFEIEKTAIEELKEVVTKEQSIEEVAQILLSNQKQQKSKKNQNKRKKKDTLEAELEVSLENKNFEEATLQNETFEVKTEDKKLKSNIVLDSSFETIENSFSHRNEISIPLLLTNSVKMALPEILTKKEKDELPQQPIFPTLSSENFTTFDDTKNDLTASMLTGFDSDENSLDTNMSVDIQKLLDDPEMTTEIAKRPDEDLEGSEILGNVKQVDIMNIKEPVRRKSQILVEDEIIKKEVLLPKNEESEKKPNIDVSSKKSTRSEKSEEKKTKRRGRKPKNHSTKVEVSSLSEYSEAEEEKDNDTIQKSKNKIVKSVFGRVFGGEKVDKVREVLDDWQSRSEHNSSDSDTEKTTKKSRSKSKKNLRNSSAKRSVETSGRSRQSKKRAEELISRAFHEDSTLLDDGRTSRNQRTSSRRNHSKSKSPSKEKVDNDDELSEENDLEIQNIETSKSKRGRKRNNLREYNFIVDSKQAKYESNNEEQQEIIDKSEESQISQSTLEQDKIQSEIENTNNETEEDDDDVHGRMSPLYARDSSEEEDTQRSTQTSDNDEEPQESRKPKKKKSRSSSNAFSSDKVVIRSPEAPTEMVTIAPTDAIEDNALDLEIPVVEKAASPEKPTRHATKVLNFDEELFVECCSRLKATSEKELRGAKKIKLDHSSADHQSSGSSLYHHQHHHRKDEQLGYKGTKDRWRDVESQNSLGSLLESVNQLLGEDYNSREKEYSTPRVKVNYHHHRHHHHHHRSRHNNASRSVSPDDGRSTHRQSVNDDEDNLGYDDSLDVAFEHNNKLRDKIQQRMRESENLIANSFGQKNSSSPAVAAEADVNYISYDYDGQSKAKNNGLGGLLDKALSNLLHNNEKHDNHASTPMKLLAELACARAPTSTTPTVPEKPPKPAPIFKEAEILIDEPKQQHEHHHHHHHHHHGHHHHHHESKASSPKKPKNPIKELFERKKEQYEKKQLEKPKTSKSSEKSKKQKKVKNVQHNLPLIRTSQFRGGMVERKKRRDGSLFCKKKEQISQNKIKDIYDFDEEESASEPGFASVMSYRVKVDPEPKEPKVPIEFNMSSLITKAISDTLMNGDVVGEMGENLQSLVDRKFQDIDKFVPKSKASTKTITENVKPPQPAVIGPMDEFVERRPKSKRSFDDHSKGKHSGKSKKKSGKGAKKKSRNAWYEDDSSDEFITKLKADDIGVGISKSQRTCSKGKQNLFAEMSSTSSESEFERGANDEDEGNFESNKLVVASEPPADEALDELEEAKNNKDLVIDESQNAESQEDWPAQVNDHHESKSNSPVPDYENNKKSESEELSDHPLVIDENHKEPDIEQRTNSDDETERRTFELDDLYREDSSIVDSDRDESSVLAAEDKSNSLLKAPETTTASSQDKKSASEKYISLEDALELLDQPQQDNSILTSLKKEKSPSIVKQSTPEAFQKNKRKDIDDSQDDEEVINDDLPEKFASNEKPQRQSENLPLHVFLSRKVQESKKRKQQQQLKKLQEEQERIFLDLQPTRRQRKCAIGKQGLLAEISSSDEELSVSYSKKSEKSDYDKARNKHKQRESKEKRKERYIEKKHEQMIAKEQKAIEEAIMRELEEKRLSAASEASGSEKDEVKQTEATFEENSKSIPIKRNKATPKKHSHKQKNEEATDEIDSPNKTKTVTKIATAEINTGVEELNSSTESATTHVKKRKPAATKSPQKSKKSTPGETKKSKQPSNNSSKRSKARPTSANRNKDGKEQQRSQSSRRESDQDGDEEIKAARSWNKVDEGVGVAIGRRKRAAANQLYYWSSSSDEEEPELPAPSSTTAVETVGVVGAQEGQDDDRQEQHGWIVGDSHKKMITMLAMEKQMKEKRRRSENDEQAPGVGAGSTGGKGKKKHRNSTS